MNNNKEKHNLFLMMEKLNPDFKQHVNEITLQPQAQQTTQNQQNLASDVNTMQKAANTANTLKKANQRINTSTEFPQAFKIWFQSLGYKPDGSMITISKVLADVRKAMQELGFK